MLRLPCGMVFVIPTTLNIAIWGSQATLNSINFRNFSIRNSYLLPPYKKRVLGYPNTLLSLFPTHQNLLLKAIPIHQSSKAFCDKAGSFFLKGMYCTVRVSNKYLVFIGSNCSLRCCFDIHLVCFSSINIQSI